MFFLISRKIFLQFFIDLVYFPIWWYSIGTRNMIVRCMSLIKDGNDNFSPGLWLKNIFVPMFGQTDWQGRIMSFFMRLVNVIGRSIALFIWILIIFCLFLFWVLFPIFVFFEIVQSFFAL